MDKNQTLLEKANEYADKFQIPFQEVAIKAYLAGSENNGLKWVQWKNRKPEKSGEYIFKVEWPKMRINYGGIFWLYGGEKPIKSYDDELVYWLDESLSLLPCIKCKEREKELESLSGHNRAIIKDLNDQRTQLREKDSRIKELEEALREIYLRPYPGGETEAPYWVDAAISIIKTALKQTK